MNTKLILAALMMSLSLAACGQRDEAPADVTEAAPPADTAPAEATPPAETDSMDGAAPDAADADAGDAPAEGDVAEPEPAAE